jgi:hypothetical protein
MPPRPADAGWLKNTGIVGAAVAGYEFEAIAAASAVAVMAANTPAYKSAVDDLATKLSAHRFNPDPP